MKKRLNILYMIGFFLMQLVWVGCEEEELLAPSFPEGEGIEEGMVSIVLRPSAGNEVITRANESGNLGEEEAIEYVTLLLFDNADGLTDDASRSLLTFANQQLVEQNNRISLYLQARKQILYAICNYPDTAELKNIRNLEELKALSTTITRKDGAYTGRYILEGMVDITPSGTPEQIASTYTIRVQRIAAAFSFNIRFDPTHEDDKFEISGVYIHNIPKGSYLLNRNEAETDTLKLCTGDYVYAATDEDRKQRYFWGDSLRLDLTAYTDDRKRTGYKASFMQFENRQGGVDDASGAWESLAGLKGQTVNGMDAYEYYRQIYKRDIAEGKIEATKAFTAPYASYLTIHGIYRVATGTPFKVVYYLYLGADNYKDFNVRRNYSYNHEVVIRSKEEIQDSRQKRNRSAP